MIKVWKLLLILLVLTALVWLSTLWRWQTNHVDPSTQDIVLQLVLLPLGLTAFIAISIWMVRRLRKYAVAPLPAPSAAASKGNTEPDAAQSKSGQAERVLAWNVLQSNALLRAGAEWGSIHAAIQSGECKAELDPVLVGDDEVAFFTCRNKDITDEAALALLTDSQGAPKAQDPKSAGAGTTQSNCRPEMLRAMVLLQKNLEHMEEGLSAQVEVLVNQEAEKEQRSSASLALAPSAIQLQIAVPARWTAAEQLVASTLVNSWLAALQKKWQQDQQSAHAATVLKLQLLPVENAEKQALAIDNQLLQWHRSGTRGLLLAMATDSLIGLDSISALSEAGVLFGVKHQNGTVPGEGAAALLLANANWPMQAEAVKTLPRLMRLSLVQRQKSADDIGKVSIVQLQQATQDCLQASGLQASDISAICSDTDRRASRNTEVLEVMNASLAHLEPNEHALCLGIGCGEMGVARYLVSVATAATQVQTKQAPILVLGANDALQRSAQLVNTQQAPTPASA